MPSCRDCRSTNIEPDAPTEDGYFAILAELNAQSPTAQIPGEQHCDDWLGGKGIGPDQAEQVATAMLASLRYDPKKAVWVRGKTEYVQIWAVFQSWLMRELRPNGHRPGTSMKVKQTGGY